MKAKMYKKGHAKFLTLLHLAETRHGQNYFSPSLLHSKTGISPVQFSLFKLKLDKINVPEQDIENFQWSYTRFLTKGLFTKKVSFCIIQHRESLSHNIHPKNSNEFSNFFGVESRHGRF